MNDDVRNLDFGPNKKNSYLTPVLIFLAVIYVGFLLYQAVYLNYATNQKIKKLREDLKIAQNSKARLDLLINYYKTSTFQELEARKKLGLKMPGEIVVRVDVVNVAPTQITEKKEGVVTQIKQNNSQYWIDYLLGREQI
jgi:hypothetical protein